MNYSLSPLAEVDGLQPIPAGNSIIDYSQQVQGQVSWVIHPRLQRIGTSGEGKTEIWLGHRDILFRCPQYVFSYSPISSYFLPPYRRDTSLSLFPSASVPNLNVQNHLDRTKVRVSVCVCVCVSLSLSACVRACVHTEEQLERLFILV